MRTKEEQCGGKQHEHGGGRSKGLKSLLTLCRAALAALVGAAAQRAQVAVLQRAVAVVAARATGRDQLEQVLLRHEAARKRPAT